MTPLCQENLCIALQGLLTLLTLQSWGFEKSSVGFFPKPPGTSFWIGPCEIVFPTSKLLIHSGENPFLQAPYLSPMLALLITCVWGEPLTILTRNVTEELMGVVAQGDIKPAFRYNCPHDSIWGSDVGAHFVFWAPHLLKFLPNPYLFWGRNYVQYSQLTKKLLR